MRRASHHDRPALYAAALRDLGYRPDAEDAVHETCLVALRHIGAVRQPEAVGGWLHAVLRRACLQQRRRRRREILTDAPPEIADRSPRPDERIERTELRDWIWGALQNLPEPLRVAAMLRWFGSYDAYGEVAAILGIPVGTVRSRLSEARRKLAESLLARARAREWFWADAVRGIFRRGDGDAFVAHFSPDLHLAWSSGRMARGREHLAAEIESDLAVGIRLDPTGVMATDGVTVVEGRFVNPVAAPDHCPPGIALVVFGADDRASRIHLHLAPRLPRVAAE